MQIFTLKPGQLSLADLKLIICQQVHITLDQKAKKAMDASHQIVKQCIQKKQAVYGVNTGFGALVDVGVAEEQWDQLQRHLILSHAAGIGPLLDDEIVSIILVLKIASLARGYSGIRPRIVDALMQLYHAKIYPCIPSKGSVGASGDLAPLAHMAAILIGEGCARFQNKIITAKQALSQLDLRALTLKPKEGLALVNGTQVSTALAVTHLFRAENVFAASVVTGCLSLEAIQGNYSPFDERLQVLSEQRGQQKVAELYRDILQIKSKNSSKKYRLQDPYSFRCQPQVMGACLDQLRFIKNILQGAINAVSDNPIVFAEDSEILSGGNFHGESIAMAADNMALAIAEIGSLSERRIAVLTDSNFSGLPLFLVEKAGVNTGFMLAQVTAAALVSENKSLAHPASVDSIPTSANQEDHVSMATYAARRLGDMLDNTLTVVAIELLAACQAVELRDSIELSTVLLEVLKSIRTLVPHYDQDRFFATDIETVKDWLKKGRLLELSTFNLLD